MSESSKEFDCENEAAKVLPATAVGLEKFGLFFKRITDFLLSIMVLICFVPLFICIALAIKLDSPGPVIFRQKRIGLNGKLFNIYKFRTMLLNTPDLPTDEMRRLGSPVTRVGKLLRLTSLDEMPQLLNVLQGNMSLVGPRPALYNQTALTRQRKMLGILRFPPGITGWAQINGRNEIPDEIKIRLDKWYCDNWSYWLDWKVLFYTFMAVLSGRGAS